MAVIALLVTFVLYIFILVLTIDFYVRGGGYNRWINWGSLTLLVAVLLLRDIVSLQAFIAWYIGVLWLLFLVATNVFTKCKTANDFLSAYRPRFARVLTSLLLLAAAINAMIGVSTEKIIFLFLAIVLWFSFAKLISYPRGQIRVYRACLTTQICLLFALAGILSHGRLYEVKQMNDTIVVSLHLVIDGQFNGAAIQSVSEDLIDKYGVGIIWTYIYFILGLLYHGLLRNRARGIALKSYVIMLILNLYYIVPEVRGALGGIPVIGKYITSPAILLAAMAVSMVLVLMPRQALSTDTW